MELLFNIKQHNVVAKINEEYYFLSKKPKKLVFDDDKHKKAVLKHFKPLKAIAEEHSVIDESLTLKQWNNLPVWLENESKGAEGNLEITKFLYGNIYLYINGGCLCGNIQEYVLSGIIELYKQNELK
jgi:hypothetical protein